MACGILYKSVLVITKLIRKEDFLFLDLPFEIYGYNIIMNKKDITHSLNDLTMEGKEVLAKVDYKVEDEKIVNKFIGKIGCSWDSIKTHPKYITHANIKKEDVFTVCDSKGLEIKYCDTDKNDLIPFCVWEDVVEKKELFLKKADFLISKEINLKEI